MTRRRSKKEFDYWGVAAIGDYEYDDGMDKWEEIQEAFKSSDEINLKRSHGDVRNVGAVKYWDLDKTNKTVSIGFNKADMDEDIKFDEINQVSIEYQTLGDKITGVNHIAIGNSFKQKCPLKVCNITKQRGDEPDTVPDAVDVPDEIEEVEVPEEQPGSEEEEISNKILMEEIKLLKKQIEEMSKVEDEPESDPAADVDVEETDKKIKLGFQEKIKHDLPSTDNKPKTGFTKWNWHGN